MKDGIDDAALQIVVVFFFSSRGRHTRLQGDWSSDVCSSDLCWDTRAPQDSPARRVQGLTYAELKQRTGFPDSLRERLDADVWPPALEWAGYIIELEEIGRASCRERGEEAGVAVELKKENDIE